MSEQCQHSWRYVLVTTNNITDATSAESSHRICRDCKKVEKKKPN